MTINKTWENFMYLTKKSISLYIYFCAFLFKLFTKKNFYFSIFFSRNKTEAPNLYKNFKDLNHWSYINLSSTVVENCKTVLLNNTT